MLVRRQYGLGAYLSPRFSAFEGQMQEAEKIVGWLREDQLTGHVFGVKATEKRNKGTP